MSENNEPIAVNDADFKATVLDAQLPAVVDFWAAWCGPCRMVAPTVEELAREYFGKAVVAKLDADVNPQTMMQYGVLGIPTLIFFKGGKEVDRLVGAYPKAAIVKKLESVLAR
ncbi:MAG: thioredoxin [Chloroflexi bacterium]|nr:thioredoxin [Chloroflexota bacterium]